MGVPLFIILSIFLIEMSGFGAICMYNNIQDYEPKKKNAYENIMWTGVYLLAMLGLWYLLIIYSPIMN